MDKYGYKAVLIVPGAHYFRGNDLEAVGLRVDKLKQLPLPVVSGAVRFKTQDDVDYVAGVYEMLNSMSDYDIRVETPLMSVYTNNPQDIDKLCNINLDRVKYISKPPEGGISKNTVIMEQEGWDYKITLGRTRQSYQEFVEWAENGKGLVKLTGGCKSALLRNNHWGGCHFYVKNDKALTMIRMFLGGSISRVDQVVKAG